MRVDGRQPDEMRRINITPDVLKYADGSALIEFGNTHVLCTATMDNHPAPHLIGTGQGWVTAEYDMLPCASSQRKIRDRVKGKIAGRSAEIQRLIGRALRAVVDLQSLGERTFYIDCDVIQADGGTRTAAISGGFIALALAMKKMVRAGKIGKMVINDFLAAASAGIVESRAALDLSYIEDSQADVDLNVVMNSKGHLIEVQGTAETDFFSRAQMNEMLDLAEKGINEIVDKQKEVLDINEFPVK